MIRLKELRLKTGRTQADVAAELGTNQQTYARWENGKSNPPHAMLGKMAELFGATFDYILARELPAGNMRQRPSGRDTMRYWGDVGLRPRGGTKTIGFPVTAEQAERLRARIASGERLPDWVTFEAMNNRILAFRPKQMRRIWLVDEADEFPEDFHFSHALDTAGRPTEIYRALADWVDKEEGGDDVFSDHPKALQESALEVIERAGLTDDPYTLGELLRNTVIHHVDGEVEAYEVNHDDLASAMFHLEHSKNVDVIELSATESSFERYHPLEDLALIEFSAIELQAAWEKERS